MEDVKLEALEYYIRFNLSNVTFTKEEDGVYIGSDGAKYIVYTEDEVAELYAVYENGITNTVEKDIYLLLKTNGYDKWTNYIKIDTNAISNDVELANMEDILNVKYVLEKSMYYNEEYYTICIAYDDF